MLAWLLRIRSVQEVNEWWPDVQGISPLVGYQYRNIMFKYSNGSFVISQNLIKKMRALPSFDSAHSIFYLPILAEPVVYKTDANVSLDFQYVFWCGMVDGYIRDVLFILDAFEKVFKNDRHVKLIISGKYSEDSKRKLLDQLRNHSIPEENFMLTGFVADKQLLDYVFNASVLISPMWKDHRSSTRFPTKLGIYASSGRPIILAPIGEVGEYFHDNFNCYFYEAESVSSLGDKIVHALANKELSSTVGSNAKITAHTIFSYEKYTKDIIEFLNKL
jgi:glycosyltransferase involved in cell wall biosynthesis